MGLGDFIGGMGIAYQGAARGVQDGLDRRNAAEDRDFLLRQRQLQEGQQQRALDAQVRADAQRAKLAAIKPAGTPEDVVPAAGGGADAATDPSSVDAQNGSDVGAPNTAATPKLRTQDQELLDTAKVMRENGDIGKAMELESKAGAMVFARAAGDYSTLLAGAGNQSAGDLARQISGIVQRDGSNRSVTGVEDLPEGGVRLTITNKDTGFSAARDYTGPQAKQQLADTFRAYYSPQMWEAMQKEAHKSALKTQEELTKTPVTSVPNGFFDKRTGKFVQTRADAVPAGTAAAAKGPKPAIDQVHAFISEAATKGETKLEGGQIAAANDYGAQLITENPKLPPSLAARLSIQLATNPALLKPEIDLQTGRFALMVKDEQSGESFSLKPGIGDATHLPAGVKPEDAQAKTADMLSRLDAKLPGAQDLYTKAAFDKSGAARAQLDQWTKGQIGKAMASVPGFTQLPAESQAAAVDKAFGIEADAMQGRLNLVAQFGKAPKAEAAARSGGIGNVGGMDPEALARALARAPAAVRERVAAKQSSDAASAKSRAEADAADAKKRADRISRLQTEAAWITPQTVAVMTPREAGDAYRKYSEPEVLDAALLRALRKRM